MDMKLRYLCSIQNFLKKELDDRCVIKKNDIPPPIIKKEYKQVIIIPRASKSCNEGWNYINKEWTRDILAKNKKFILNLYSYQPKFNISSSYYDKSIYDNSNNDIYDLLRKGLYSKYLTITSLDHIDQISNNNNNNNNKEA
jgi:hypothetical protein